MKNKKVTALIKTVTILVVLCCLQVVVSPIYDRSGAVYAAMSPDGTTSAGENVAQTTAPEIPTNEENEEGDPPPKQTSSGQLPLQLPSLSDVICKTYLAYDTQTKQMLVNSRETEKIFPASMTKVLTAALALEYLSTDVTLAVSQAALDGTTPDSSMMGLGLGEQVTFTELMFGLLLPSGNDAANVLAEGVVTAAGYTDPTNPDKTKLQLFADMMNNKIAELGLTDTHFVNASGLHDENHYTTAMDMVKIFEYAMTYDIFLEIIAAPSHVFKATNLHTYDGWLISRNSNHLVSDPWILGEQTMVAQIIGGKTGTTSAAGSCLVMLTLNKNGHYMISVVAGIPYSTVGSFRMATFMAAVVNQGSQVCYYADPVIRVDGDVITNAAKTIPAGWVLPEPEKKEDETPPDTTEQEGVPDPSSGENNHNNLPTNANSGSPDLGDIAVVVMSVALLLLASVTALWLIRKMRR